MPRKRRCDRNHLVYRIDGPNAEFYIGVTQVVGRAVVGSLKIRFGQHLSRARNAKHDWPLYRAMHLYGLETFRIKLIEVVRGKKEVHSRERELIRLLGPTLNEV